ncbi:thermosome subunit alpha [Halobacteriaceae archaeon GCM10025711]
MALRQGMGGQPIYILSEDTQRTRGRDAQGSNIAAGKAVAQAVRTTLGPRGMDKMLVDSSGEVVITNDGATILQEMDIEHPAAQMLVEVAETQEDEVGDGTTTAAVLAGHLLAKAEGLLEQDVHPRTIIEGYAEARRIALDAIDDLVVNGDPDEELLVNVAKSSMTGKGTGDVSAETLAELVVEAVGHAEREDGTIDRDDIHVHARKGASSGATSLVEGVIVDEEPTRDDMPRTVEDATIAVLDGKLSIRETEVDAEYNIQNVDQLNAALDAEERELRSYADALDEAGVDVLFATKSIDDRATAYLAKHGILVFDDLKNSDAKDVARATGAVLIGTVADLDEADFGRANRVHVEKFDTDELTFIEGGAAAKAVTMFVRGGTEHVVDELERALGDAIDVVVAARDKGGVVPGAGMTEMHIADRVRDEAASITGRRQLAVEAFAEAVEVLPRTLAENAGMDPIDALVDLRAANESGRAGVIATGERGEIADPFDHGIFDPAAVKREAVESATEAATMIVRIDDIIASN